MQKVLSGSPKSLQSGHEIRHLWSPLAPEVWSPGVWSPDDRGILIFVRLRPPGETRWQSWREAARTDPSQAACIAEEHRFGASHAAMFPPGVLGSRQVRGAPRLGDGENAVVQKSRVLSGWFYKVFYRRH